MKTLFAQALVCFVLIMSLQATANDKAQPQLPTVTLIINDVELTTEIAEQFQQRYMGLSFREQLAPNAGMIFVYPREQQLTFTMRNTLLPLTIAYLSKDMKINEFHEMPVGPNQFFPSKLPAQFALEVNQGWFEKNGIVVGDQVTIR